MSAAPCARCARRAWSGAAAWTLALALFAVSPRAAAVPVPAEVERDSARASVEEVADAIDTLRLAEAERLLATLDPSQPRVVYEHARLAFHRGAYAEAVKLIDGVLGSPVLAGRPRERARYEASRALYASTAEVTGSFDVKRSADGRYEVHYPPGKDALVASYALPVLAAADKALSELLEVSLEPPLRLEIFASPEDLARVSSLTVEQIETTGTVALSKWNRLMITSPKALVRGYPWADTITHELVHLLVSRKTGDHAPVWLQEGIAKLFERAWRASGRELFLDGGARALLHERNAKGTLITFAQMHPSIAMLPSDEDASLAFAQVATFMERYVAEHGQAALRAALDRLQRGDGAEEALASAAGTHFAKLEATWKAGLPRSSTNDDARRIRMRFKKGGGVEDESREVKLEGARKHLRLGDLMWDRGRTTAAAREYEKAYREDPLDPIVTSRWARAALQVEQTQAVVEVLEPHLQRHPGHAPAHAMLGRAHLQLGDLPAARTALKEAIWINPFDPDPHCDLGRAAESEQERAAEHRACDELR